MKKYITLLIFLSFAFAKAQTTVLNQKTVITQPATAATPAAKILSRNTDGVLVETDKTVTQLDKQNLSEFVDDIGATDPTLANTVFVNTVTGNDSTGVLQVYGKPFKTEAAAFNAVPNDGNEWTIQFIDGNVTRMVTSSVTTKKVLYKTTSGGIIDFTNAVWSGSESLKIEAFNARVIIFGNNNYVVNSNNPFFIKCKELDITGGAANPNFPMFKGDNTIMSVVEVDILNFNMKLYYRWLGQKSNITIGTLNYTTGEYGIQMSVQEQEESSISIDNINLIGGNRKIFFNSSTVGYFKLGNVYGDGSLRMYADKNPVVKSILDINNSVFENVVEVFSSWEGITLTGTNLSNNYNLKISDNTHFTSPKEINFLNFSGKIKSVKEVVGDDLIVSLINSNIEVEDYFIRLKEDLGAGAGSTLTNSVDNMTILGFCSVLSESPSTNNLILNQKPGNPLIIQNKGTFKTNFKSYGLNVSEDILSATFKETTGEIVIRSKIDLVNKTLNPYTSYLLDADLVLTDNDSIIVPFVAGRPNLTLNGYGLESGSITKTGTSPLFVSPEGGSGGLQMEAIKLKCIGCPVFDLTDATGFNAVELVKVNIEDSGAIGTLDGYRQSLMTNIGLFNNSDGMTFEGAWLGGFRSQNVIVRNLAGSTGTLFKKGTSLTFGSRFYTDLNADIPAGWAVSDFDTTNFSNPNTFQVQNAILTRAGASDDTDAGYFPNINEEDTAAQFSGNVGLKNSALPLVKLKSPNGTVYQLKIDDAGNVITN